MRKEKIIPYFIFVSCVFAALSLFFSIVALGDESITVTSQQKKPEFAFVLFYMASCPHCQRFDPILKAYAMSHRIPVLAYTLDGQSLESFPNSVTPSIAEITHFFPNQNPVVPTLFLMNIQTKQLIPVLQGEAREDQLDFRMREIEKSLFDEN